MPTPKPSLRQIAKSLGLSHTTVSDALRNSSRVKPATRKLVLDAAEKAGYSPNPLATAMMSHLRRKSGSSFRGVIAILDLDGDKERPDRAARYHNELVAGVRDRAEQLGFKVELVTHGRDGISLSRLDTILQSRGIHGLLVLPAINTPTLKDLNLEEFAVIYTDYAITDPPIHTVCPDHYLAMMDLLPRLEKLGYRRPGLILDKAGDQRLLFRWEAAYNAYMNHQSDLKWVPPLIADGITSDIFAGWFRVNQPDVILAHRAKVISWLEKAGASVPETHGFCSLNVTMTGIPCAGLDLQPRILSERATELLTGQLYHNEYGPPKVASITMVPPRWVDGPTLKKRSD
ncbi:MAG: LacI family transcriptional regulator [Verrucomicrobiae bacterium]|nr:LacI family transcriptional regulator [Verrucomicrobiae bacterium]